MVEICIVCRLQHPRCLMSESKMGEEKYCMDCEQSKKCMELQFIDDLSSWWRQQAKYHYEKKKINNAAIVLQRVWKKYLRSYTAKYYWCERMLDYEDIPKNYFTDGMLNYMEQIVEEMNNPQWEGSVKDFDQLAWMLDNLEVAQGAYKTLPSWWNWTDIRNKNNPIIWSDYSVSSDSE